MSRFFMPNDAWECPECKKFYLVGKKGTCGSGLLEIYLKRKE